LRAQHLLLQIQGLHTSCWVCICSLLGGAAWSVLWSAERKRQRAFMIFGLELILQLDTATTREFFTTFFKLPPWYQPPCPSINGRKYLVSCLVVCNPGIASFTQEICVVFLVFFSFSLIVRLILSMCLLTCDCLFLRLWRGFLASKLSSAELLVFALFTFAVAPNGLRFQLVKHLVTDPSGAHMLQAYLGQENS